MKFTLVKSVSLWLVLVVSLTATDAVDSAVDFICSEWIEVVCGEGHQILICYACHS